ncbi:hypothetical protein BJY24_005594 [Nocardia transvalensis]|uniref:Uncharacterized protein n=1 Tax=Nocardia transvalensis TaxID=37333 RepID=A0A7W9UKV0_9NOCA|nr:hypothetical protein [Nocardia transvalensis]MBB5916682.1 hypothetical protein [Nocardia transvalensis]
MRSIAEPHGLQLRAMLAGAAEPVTAPMPELDSVFARIARESVGIQDLDARMHPEIGEAW